MKFIFAHPVQLHGIRVKVKVTKQKRRTDMVSTPILSNFSKEYSTWYQVFMKHSLSVGKLHHGQVSVSTPIADKSI